jgi:hypothetical protein
VAECKHLIEEATCGVCLPRPVGGVTFPARLGPPVAARFAGECGACDQKIEPGDVIRADGEGGWLCRECAGEPPGGPEELW